MAVTVTPPQGLGTVLAVAVAVDGKTLRGSGHHDTSQLHLLAVMDHTTCGVLGQTGDDGKANEITRFQPPCSSWSCRPRDR